jgi:hypothetical protein
MASVDVWETDTRVTVTARGGSRRERGSSIGAAVRGRGWALVGVYYSETYGFQSASFARYRKV